MKAGCRKVGMGVREGGLREWGERGAECGSAGRRSYRKESAGRRGVGVQGDRLREGGHGSAECGEAGYGKAGCGRRIVRRGRMGRRSA